MCVRDSGKGEICIDISTLQIEDAGLKPVYDHYQHPWYLTQPCEMTLEVKKKKKKKDIQLLRKAINVKSKISNVVEPVEYG